MGSDGWGLANPSFFWKFFNLTKPLVIIYVIEIPSFYYGNATYHDLIMYVILCILSYDFSKLTILYMYVGPT